MLKDFVGSMTAEYFPFSSVVALLLPSVIFAPATACVVEISLICPCCVGPLPPSPPPVSVTFWPSVVLPASAIGGGGLTSPAPHAAKKTAIGKAKRRPLGSMGD